MGHTFTIDMALLTELGATISVINARIADSMPFLTGLADQPPSSQEAGAVTGSIASRISGGR
jgi:hypothetical protein